MTEVNKTEVAEPKTDKVTKVEKTKAPAKKTTAKKAAPVKETKETKPTGKMAKKITILAKECPVRKGTNRAKFWAKLKNGMTLAAIKDANVPLRFVGKMVRAKHLDLNG